DGASCGAGASWMALTVGLSSLSVEITRTARFLRCHSSIQGRDRYGQVCRSHAASAALSDGGAEPVVSAAGVALACGTKAALVSALVSCATDGEGPVFCVTGVATSPTATNAPRMPPAAALLATITGSNENRFAEGIVASLAGSL